MRDIRLIDKQLISAKIINRSICSKELSFFDILKFIIEQEEVNLTDDDFEGCQDCEYHNVHSYLEPCSKCRHNFVSYYSPKKG